MQKNNRRRLAAALSTTALTVTASLTFAASPAHAYGSEIWTEWAGVDTSDCTRSGGTLWVIAETDRCKLPDSADGTYFYKDAGGSATKIVVQDSNGMVGKVEFHPSGEKLYVYDTRNDGDTIYVKLCTYSGACYGPYTAPGTSTVIEYRVIDLNIAEGEHMTITVYDDSAGTDRITYRGGTA